MVGLQILQRRRKVAERYVQAFADIPAHRNFKRSGL